MWFKREHKNRRLNRGHVLDVRLRSEQVRATRIRLVVAAIGVPAVTVFGLYLLWRTGEWALDKFVYENADFAIQRVDVQTDGVIAPDQLRSWSGVKPGANLIALDLASVKRNLELWPVIGSVSVERVLPRTLKIRVTERKPIAQINMPRAVGAFRHVGFPVEAYPVDYTTTGPADAGHLSNSIEGGVIRTDAAVHEWIGLIAYRLLGRTNALFPGP